MEIYDIQSLVLSHLDKFGLSSKSHIFVNFLLLSSAQKRDFSNTSVYSYIFTLDNNSSYCMWWQGGQGGPGDQCVNTKSVCDNLMGT